MAAQVKCITLSARDLAELLGISRSAAYALFHREDFPTLKIGLPPACNTRCTDAMAQRGRRQEKCLNMQRGQGLKPCPHLISRTAFIPQLVQNLHTCAILFTYNRTVCAERSILLLMARKNKKREAGSGSITKRKDGRWQGQYVSGYNPETGKPRRHTIYGQTQKMKLAEKLRCCNLHMLQRHLSGTA